MDKKEDFAERRARQKEKLRAQRAERQTAATSGKPSSSSRSPKGGSPGNSDDTDDAFVHVDKADAAEAPLPASGPAQAGPSSSNTVADKLFNALPSESGTKSDVSSAPYSKPAQEAESNRAESGRSTAGQQAETQSMAALHLGNDADLLAKSDPEPRQDHIMLPLDHSAARKLQQSMAGAGTEDAGQSEHPAGRQAGSDTSEVDARQQQSQVPSQRKVGPAEQRPSPEHGAVQSQAALEEQAGGARQAARAKGSAMPDTHSPSAHGRDSSGWSWGKGWLPTAALQQVAAGAAPPLSTHLYVTCSGCCIIQLQTGTDDGFRALHHMLRVTGCPVEQRIPHTQSLAMRSSDNWWGAGALKDVQEMKESLQQVGTSAHSAESL